MLSRMTWRQLVEWKMFSEIEPLSDERADIRAALVCSVIANVNRGKKQRPIPLTKFMLDFTGKKKAEKKPLTDPNVWAKFKSTMKADAATSDAVAAKKQAKKSTRVKKTSIR